MSVTKRAWSARSQPRTAASSSRSIVAPVQETLAVVLDEDISIPDSDQDIHDLILRLRGHLIQLGPSVPVSPTSSSSAQALDLARRLALADMPADCMPARVRLRTLAFTVQAVLAAMGAEGLVCVHRPECPSAQASDYQAARVRIRCPEAGCSVLCNGVLLFDDTGCLRPDSEVIKPCRPLPLADDRKAVEA